MKYFPRRLIVVCRRFGTLYQFHLHRLDVKYEVLHTLHPALEDGTDRGFRNVGKPQSDAGEIPKRIHTKKISISATRHRLTSFSDDPLFLQQNTIRTRYFVDRQTDPLKASRSKRAKEGTERGSLTQLHLCSVLLYNSQHVSALAKAISRRYKNTFRQSSPI